MKKTVKFLISALCIAALCGSVAAFGGCGKKANITVSGSSSVTPIMEKLAAEYEKTHDVRITINMSSSGNGISDVKAGLNDFGMASRALGEGDADENNPIEGKILCMDGIALVVSKTNAADNVSKDDVKALFASGTAIQGTTITSGVGRDASSGTRSAFDELMGIKEAYHTSVATLAETGNVIESIEKSDNSLGYISFGSLTDKIKAVKLDGVACTVENIMSGAYSLQRPFVIVRKQNGTLSAAAQGFYDYIMSKEAQSIITGSGYISVSGK